MDNYWGKTAATKATTADAVEAGAEIAPIGGKRGGKKEKGRGKEDPGSKDDLDGDLDSYFGAKKAAKDAPPAEVAKAEAE
jgi:hypothetical protein